MLLRAKTTGLLQTRTLTEKQINNTKLNQEEMAKGITKLQSKPQRLVLELTNACNLKCIMCGRDEANFSLTTFDINILKSLENILDEIEEIEGGVYAEIDLHKMYDFRNNTPSINDIKNSYEVIKK